MTDKTAQKHVQRVAQVKPMKCSCGHMDWEHGDYKFSCTFKGCWCLEFDTKGKTKSIPNSPSEPSTDERIAAALEIIARYFEIVDNPIQAIERDGLPMDYERPIPHRSPRGRNVVNVETGDKL